MCVNKILWFSLILYCWQSADNTSVLNRQKRLLLWQRGASRLQIIIGVGIPVDLNVETVIIGPIMKANYRLPMNSSIYTNPENIVYARRRKRSLSRWDLYELLAQAAQMRGFGDGKSCILRAICELSHTPINRYNGLFDELMHEVFNPRSTQEDLKHPTNNDYFGAQKIGIEQGQRCESFYPDCRVNMADLFTITR